MLTWEDAGTDEPRDQNAWNSTLYPHAVWTIGPNGAGWSVELVVKDEFGDEIDAVRLPDQPTERAAKSAAEAHEKEGG